MSLPENFYLPCSAKMQGKEPKYVCNLCDARFYEGEERTRVAHAIQHAKSDTAEIKALNPAIQTEPVYGEGDPELAEHMQNRYEQLKGQVPDPLNPKHY